MIRKPFAFIIGLIFVNFLFVFLPNHQAIAGECKASASLKINPNPAPFNKGVTFVGIVDLNGTVWEPMGTEGAGFCTLNGKIIRNLGITAFYTAYTATGISGPVEYFALKNAITESEKLEITKFDPGPYYFMAEVVPSDKGFKGTETLDFYVEAFGERQKLASSFSTKISLKLTAGVYEVYGCVANNGKYACDRNNSPSCSNTDGACQGKPCILVENGKCGNLAPAVVSHKECRNMLCVSIDGAGSDACTTNASCVSGGNGGTPVTTQYVFNLENPIGAENLQDLVNIIGQWIFNLAIPIAVIIIIYAGVLMLTAGGVPARFQKGAKALWYAVIGLAVVLIGKGFVTLIQSILSLRE